MEPLYLSRNSKCERCGKHLIVPSWKWCSKKCQDNKRATRRKKNVEVFEGKSELHLTPEQEQKILKLLMQLKNPFPQETKNIFLYNHKCFGCGRSDQGIEAHHCYSRTSSSPFNLVPLCNVCHAHIGHTQDEHRRLLLKTVVYLMQNDYKPTEYDYEFLESHYDDFMWVQQQL